MKNYLLLLFITLSLAISAQEKESPLTLTTATGNIQGSLVVPESKDLMPVVLIIAGSGPTDRNGNNSMMHNDAYKMMADSLYAQGIASLRYDKRGIGESRDAMVAEKDLRFENYTDDAVEWCKLLKTDKRFSELIVMGHSEGSLIGMIAAQNGIADKFVSLAGAGFKAADILRKQLSTQPAMVNEMCGPIIETLEKGDTVPDVPKMLYTLFRPDVQPYLISWFKYDPKTEISKLKCPVLIVQGTTDIQISLDDAERLKEASSNAEIVIIQGMNHVLKNAEADRMANIKTYNDPSLPLNQELVRSVVKFIKSTD